MDTLYWQIGTLFYRGLAKLFEWKTLIDNMFYLLDNESKFIIGGLGTKSDLKTAKFLGVCCAQDFYPGRSKRIGQDNT